MDESLRSLAQRLDGPDSNELKLEQAVATLARVAPTRGTADLLDRFARLLRESSAGLHGEEPPIREVVARLYHETIAVLRDLFGPISLRLASMDDLASLETPGKRDVAVLKTRLGDERHLIYLFDRVRGPGWFRALRDDELLLPSPEGVWSAGPYVTRLVNSHPQEVGEWLAGLPRPLKSAQVVPLLRTARLVKTGGSDIAYRIAGQHLGDFDVRFQVDVLLGETPTGLRSGPRARALLGGLLTQTLGTSAVSLDTYMAAGELTMVVEATAGGDEPDKWLAMLAHRVREVAERTEPFRLRVLLPLHELRLNEHAKPIELGSAALRQAARAAARAGLSLAARLESLRSVPEPLASRFVAQHLLDEAPATTGASVAFLGTQIASNDWPSPEELALARHLFVLDEAATSLVAAKALGLAPTDINTSDDPLPDSVIRAHRWLVAIPPSTAPEWHQLDERLAGHLAPASPDGVHIRISAARFGGPPPPISEDELAALDPLAAAKRASEWRPRPESSFLDPNADSLATALREAIDSNVDAWINTDPVEVVKALRHPVLITPYLLAISAVPEQLAKHGERIVTVTELIRSRPWSAEEMPVVFDFDRSWDYASDASIQLLGKLAGVKALTANAAERAWTQVVDAFRARPPQIHEPVWSDRDPLTSAINRPSMKALEIAFSLGRTVDDTPSQELLELLNEVLRVKGTDGLEARAILATRLPYLLHHAPKWFASHEDEIIGSRAPDGLGDATLDLYLEWGAPYGPLLDRARHQVVAALGRDQHEHAIQHILHGMFWRINGYGTADVSDMLQAAGDEAVSYAGQWLGWALADAEDVDPEPLVALWNDLLERHLSPQAYRGFGWMALNEHICEDDWLNLMLLSTIATEGAVDEPDRVAERSATSSTDARAGEIIWRLIASDLTPWDLQRIGATGLDVLPDQSNGDVATELRERLLERGFYEAKNL